MQFLCIFPLSFSSFEWKYIENKKKMIRKMLKDEKNPIQTK